MSGKFDAGDAAEKVDSSGQSPPRTPPRRRGCLGFLRKWWWLLLLILIIIVLVILLPIIYVAVPKIVRHNINDAKLTIQGFSITNTQNSSYRLAINSTVTTGSSQSATIEAFNASLYLTDKSPQTPFAVIEMPKVKSKKTIPVNITQSMTITDQQAVADFASWYLLNSTLNVTVDGWTHVEVGKLPKVKVHFQKTVTMIGINSFSGINITSSTVSLVPDAQGDNFFGSVNIPNPSVATFDIGNASFASMVGATAIGQVFIDNMRIVPGANNFTMRAAISQLPLINTLMRQPYCNTGVLPLSVVGENITNHGNTLAYLEPAFRMNNITLQVDVGADLAAAGLPLSGCASSTNNSTTSA